MKKKKRTKELYDKPISFYPLKPEEALAAFVKVKPKKVVGREKKG
jgi:hypothetical protein